jgi:hypothetical protein
MHHRQTEANPVLIQPEAQRRAFPVIFVEAKGPCPRFLSQLFYSSGIESSKYIGRRIALACGAYLASGKASIGTLPFL